MAFEVDPSETKRPRPLDEQADFVMSFVDESADRRDDMEAIWDEVEDNFLVRPYRDHDLERSTKYPYADSHTTARSTMRTGRSELKDPETHQEVMTIVSAIMSKIMPDEEGIVRAVGRGFEDIARGTTSSRLIEYWSRLPGHYWEFFSWIQSAGIYGTGTGEAFYDFVEEPRTFRSIDFDPFTGAEVSTSTVLNVPVWDDVRFENFAVRDFYPDTGATMIHRMKGAARHFKITAQLARDRAEAGIYKKKAVEESITARHADDLTEKSKNQENNEAVLNSVRKSHPAFLEMDAWRYCGEVPFRVKGDDNDFMRREIVVINGETVRSKVWPRRLPWFDIKITPRQNSFWGISPGELIRHDQDFADVMKMMLADASVRMAHPPQIYDLDSGVEVAKLRSYQPEVPIGVEGNPANAISTVQYNAQLQEGFLMYSGVKDQMRQATSAIDTVQGLPAGTKRLSASEFLGQTQAANVRPEMFARVVEREFLPQLGKYTFELYQEFLEDTEDLQHRIGESNTTVPLAGIMSDFDIEWIGSRLEGTKQDELTAFREILTVGSNPAIAPMIPWIPLFQKHFRALGAHEIAAMVGNPQLMQLYMALHTITVPGGQNAQQGNGNGEVAATQPLGALPGQLFGGVPA